MAAVAVPILPIHPDPTTEAQLEELLAEGRHDNNLDCFVRGAAQAQALGLLAWELEFYKEIAWQTFVNNDTALAIEYNTRALQIALQLSDSERVHICYSNLIALYNGIGNYTEALNCANKVLDNDLASASPENHANVLNNAGMLQESLGNEQEAKKFYLQSIRFAEKNKVSTPASANLGLMYEKIGDYSESKKYLVASYKTFVKEKAPYVTNSLFGIAKLTRQKNVNTAYFILEKIIKENTIPAIHFEATHLLVELNLLENNPDLAIKNLRKLLRKPEISEHLALHMKALKLMADVLAGQRRYKTAFKYQQQYLDLQQRSLDLQARISAQVLSVNYEVQQLELERDRQSIALVEAEKIIAQKTREIFESHLEMAERLAIAGEFRDDDTGTHAYRVGFFAFQIAQRLGWPQDKLVLMRYAARLHDLGKIGISDAILRKPGKFTPEERDNMKAHAALGGRILGAGRSELLRLAELIAMYHHERWDGTGYPYGIAGNSIPEPARIVAIADVIDALLSKRAYKNAFSLRETRKVIRQEVGKQFDPRIATVALQVLTPRTLLLLRDELKARGLVVLEEEFKLLDEKKLKARALVQNQAGQDSATQNPKTTKREKSPMLHALHRPAKPKIPVGHA